MVIAAEINFALNNDQTASEETVNLRTSNAISDIQAFIPGVSACILAFVVFGTTKAFRDYFYTNLVPRSIRRKIRNRHSKTSSIVLQLPDGGQSTAALRSPGRSPGRLSPGGGGAGGVECFEMDGGESGTGMGLTGSTYELPVVTPSYQSAFDVQHGKRDDDDDEDIWPGAYVKAR